MRLKSRLLSLGLLSVALGLSVSCASNNGEAAEPGANEEVATQTQTLSDVQWGSGEEVSAQVLELGSASEVAFDDKFSTHDSTTAWQQGANLLVGLGVTSKGEILGEMSQGMKPTQADTDLSDHGEIGLASNGEFAAFASTRKLVKGDGNRNVTSALATADGYLWVESPNYETASRAWRIFTGGPGAESKLLAKSTDETEFDNVELSAEVAVPVVDGGTAYWSTLTSNERGTTSSTVLKHSLTGIEDSMIFARHATSPAVLDQGIAVLDVVTENGTVKDSEKHVPKSISLHTKQADPEVLLARSSTVDTTDSFKQLVGQDDTLMTQLAENLLVLNVPDKAVTAVQLPVDARAVGYTICGQQATWAVVDHTGASDGWQYLLDLKSNELSKVANDGLYGASFCNGDYFAWGIRGEVYPTKDAFVEVMQWKEQ